MQTTLPSAATHGRSTQLNDKHDANIGGGERAVSTAAGAALLGFGAVRGGIVGWSAALIGGTLVWHGATEHSRVYDMLGITSDDASKGSHPFARDVFTHAVETIDQPADVLYKQWRKTESLTPLFPHIDRIERINDTGSTWTANLGGREFSWTAAVVQDEPGKLIRWQSTDSSLFEQEGVIRFEESLGGRGTRVTLETLYEPLGGVPAVLFARLLGADPQSENTEALRRFKQWMEAGEIASARCPAARDDGWNAASMRGEARIETPAPLHAQAGRSAQAGQAEVGRSAAASSESRSGDGQSSSSGDGRSDKAQADATRSSSAPASPKTGSPSASTPASKSTSTPTPKK